MAPGDGFRPGGKLLGRLKAEAGSLASAGGGAVGARAPGGRGGGAGFLGVRLRGPPADESFKTIGWDTFFDKFEASQLAFVYQDATADGQQSRFGKFISRRRPR